MITQIVFLPIHSSSGYDRPLTIEDAKLVVGILIMLHIITAAWFLIRYFLVKSGKVTNKYGSVKWSDLYMPFYLNVALLMCLMVDGVIVLVWLGSLIAKLL